MIEKLEAIVERYHYLEEKTDPAIIIGDQKQFAKDQQRIQRPEWNCNYNPGL